MNQYAPRAGQSLLQRIFEAVMIFLRFLSRLFKSIWIFFPGTLFLLLALWCFWSLSQGKDIIYTFAENSKARPYFFIAVAFWVYVSWFSSRIISYFLIYKQSGKADTTEISTDSKKPNTTFANTDYFHIPVTWLNIFPRLIGFSCLLILELAVLQLTLFEAPGISTSTAGIVFILLLVLYILTYKYIETAFKTWRSATKTIFYSLLALFLLMTVLIFISDTRSLMYLFWVMVVMHVLYVFYIHLRRTDPQNRSIDNKQQNPG